MTDNSANAHERDSWKLFFTFLKITVYSCIVPMGFLPWKIRVAFPGESQLRQSRATQPTVHGGCFIVSIIHRTLTWTTGSLTCAQMLMHAIVHGGVRTLKESLHWKLTLGEKSFAAPGNRTCFSGVPVRRSTNLATSLLLSIVSIAVQFWVPLPFPLRPLTCRHAL